MPAPVIDSIAKKTGKSREVVERTWNKIKAGLKKSIPESDPKFYAVLVSTVKKSLTNQKTK
jgi:hypothetical protein